MASDHQDTKASLRKAGEKSEVSSLLFRPRNYQPFYRRRLLDLPQLDQGTYRIGVRGFQHSSLPAGRQGIKGSSKNQSNDAKLGKGKLRR
jgi:hypothetical protein